ncbi:hypothetical protein Btru_024621 [Bulinus truncatus]|nr:hypothetical protein Btru_024621 [Bulinus truncatus]
MLAKTLFVALVTALLYMRSGASLTIRAQPSILTVGFTETMTVRCNFTRGDDSIIVSPLSLALVHSPQSDNYFHDVARVSMLTRPKVITTVDKSAEVNGDIQVNGTSFIEIKWTLPTSKISGLYMCTLTGLDKSYDVIKESQSVDVQEAFPVAVDFLSLQQKILMILKQLGKLKEKDTDIDDKMNQSLSRLASQKQDIDDVRKRLSSTVNAQQVNLNGMVAALNTGLSQIRAEMENKINILNRKFDSLANSSRTKLPRLPWFRFG